ncbi:hypothetical protein D3C87_1418800 [compost metagenome]
MKVFAIRHKEHQIFMPQYKSGKGYSYWLYDDIVDNQLPVPRLIESRAKAEKIIVEWAKGVFKWVEKVNWDADPKRKMHDVGRSKNDLEVVELELKEIV